jgi:hypothetical protein
MKYYKDGLSDAKGICEDIKIHNTGNSKYDIDNIIEELELKIKESVPLDCVVIASEQFRDGYKEALKDCKDCPALQDKQTANGAVAEEHYIIIDGKKKRYFIFGDVAGEPVTKSVYDKHTGFKCLL